MTMFTKEPVVKIKATDLGLLLHAMIQANRMPEVGFADTQQSVADVLYKVNSYVKIPEKTLESLLWSANILSEMGYLDLPDGQTFSTYLINLLPEYYQYDTKYCILEHVNNSKENK